MVKQNIKPYDRQLANAFNTFFSDIVKNLTKSSDKKIPMK